MLWLKVKAREKASSWSSPSRPNRMITSELELDSGIY